MSLPLKSWCEIEKRGGVGEGLGGGHPIIPIWHAGMTAMSKPPLLPSVASRALPQTRLPLPCVTLDATPRSSLCCLTGGDSLLPELPAPWGHDRCRQPGR